MPIQRNDFTAGCGLLGRESAARTISPSRSKAGSVNWYFLRTELNETSSPWWPSSQFGTSKTIPFSILAQSVSRGRKKNCASGSTNFLISHGQATRSTLIFSRVIHFIDVVVVGRLCQTPDFRLSAFHRNALQIICVLLDAGRLELNLAAWQPGSGMRSLPLFFTVRIK